MINWPSNEKGPRELIAYSPMMAQHYRHYGDVLFFDAYKTISFVPRSIIAGHFSVNDKGARMLLTGTVMFPSNDAEGLTGLIVEYFMMNDNRLPKTIITNYEGSFNQISDRMRSLGVIYLLNPNSILKRLARKRKRPLSPEMLNSVGVAMFTHNSSLQH